MKPPFLKRKALMRLRRRFSFFRLVRQPMHGQGPARAVQSLLAAALCMLSLPAACTTNACGRGDRQHRCQAEA